EISASEPDPRPGHQRRRSAILFSKQLGAPSVRELQASRRCRSLRFTDSRRSSCGAVARMAGVPADGEVALGALWIGRRRLLTMRRMAGSCYDGDGHAERATELLQPGNGFGASVA